MKLNWISYQDLHADVERLAAQLPDDVTGIIGIPRSGMLAAELLGLHLHLPVTDIHSFQNNLRWHSGYRLNGCDPEIGKLVVLDDSYSTGKSMAVARDVIQSLPGSAYQFLFCAVYTSTFAPTSIPRVGSSNIRIFDRVHSHFATTVFCWFPPLRNCT